MTSPLVTFLITACRRASKLLMRDYFELEQIQNSPRPTVDFALQSRKKTEELLRKELLKYPNSAVSKVLEDKTTATDIHFVIEPLIGIRNLSRAIPFFAVVVVACKIQDGKIEPVASVVNFPALGEVVYAEKGGGAWRERAIDHGADGTLRLRVSKVFKTEDVVEIMNIDSSLSCDIYNAYLVAAGKADICQITSDKDGAIAIASKILMDEAGGRMLSSGDVIVLSNGLCGR
ncbi:MAG: hypothetical protein KA998_05600 [Rickettsiaceae bacterium]|nr:hypothetical protein [Rickettsiaceae bacterium]